MHDAKMNSLKEVENYSDALVYHSNQYHRLRVCLSVLQYRLSDMKDQINYLDVELSKLDGNPIDGGLYDPSGQITSQIEFLKILMLEHRHEFITLLLKETQFSLQFNLECNLSNSLVTRHPDFINKLFPYYQNQEQIDELSKIGIITIKPKDKNMDGDVYLPKDIPISFIQVWWPLCCPFEDNGYLVSTDDKNVWCWLNHETHILDNF